jgi:hypothetical protein
MAQLLAASRRQIRSETNDEAVPEIRAAPSFMTLETSITRRFGGLAPNPDGRKCCFFDISQSTIASYSISW